MKHKKIPFNVEDLELPPKEKYEREKQMKRNSHQTKLISTVYGMHHTTLLMHIPQQHMVRVFSHPKP